MTDFSRCRRLTKPDEFSLVIRKYDLNLSAGALRIRVRTNKLCRARIGIVVPKKGTPLAVRRNRVKRVVREQFRAHAESLPNVDMVVQVFSELDDQKLTQLLQQQFRALTRQLAKKSAS